MLKNGIYSEGESNTSLIFQPAYSSFNNAKKENDRIEFSQRVYVGGKSYVAQNFTEHFLGLDNLQKLDPAKTI